MFRDYYRWCGSNDGKISGVITRIRVIAPHCVSKHCIIHREALAVKRFKTGSVTKGEL